MLDELADQHGILLRRDALALGYNDNFLRRLRQAGDLVWLRQGAYVLGSRWAESSRVERHHILTHAVLQLYDDRIAVSHTSASILRGAPDWGLDLEQVHLTNLFGKGERSAARVVHHRGACRVNDVTRHQGRWITAPARSALETANLLGRVPAICILDWYLNQGLASRQEYGIQFRSMTEWPDSLDLHRKLELCDGRAGSIGETRSRLMMFDRHLPTPELQWPIYYPDGRLAGISDFAWPGHGLLGEFDGKVKYLELRRPGESIDEAVLREKRRENLLRELTGFAMIRWDWADLERPDETADRIRRMLLRPAA